MAGRTLGEAWATIRPNTAGFRKELDAGLRSAMTGLNPTILVTLDISADTAKQRTALQKKLDAIARGLKLKVGTDVDDAGLAKAKGKIDAATRNRKVKVETEVDKSALQDQVADAWLRAEQTLEHLGGLKIPVDSRGLSRNFEAVATQLTQLAGKAQDVKLDPRQVDAFSRAVDAATGRVSSLDDKLEAAAETTKMMASQTIPKLDMTLASSQINHLDQQANKLSKDIANAVSPGGITFGKVSEDAIPDLKNLQNALETIRGEINSMRGSDGNWTIVSADDVTKVKALQGALGSLSKAVADNGVKVSSTTKSYRGIINTLVDISRTEIPLFNGAFDKTLPHFLAVASGFHLITEAAIETIAVWVPAAVALGIFGVAAAKTAVQVAQDTKNMETAASGTGQAFAGMSKKAGKSLSDMAKPYVYTAYGLGMIAMQKQSQTTGTVVQNMGSTIDKWMTEAVMAYQKSTGQMSLTGSRDFTLIGDSFKQLGTSIGAFIKMTPGYAEDLLRLGDGFLHLVSAILNNPVIQGVGAFALAFHGAFFYIGLGVTVLTKLSTWLLRPLAGISALSGAMNKLGIESDGTEGKLSKLGNAITAGWNSGTGRMSASVEDTMDDMGNIMVKAGPKLEGDAEAMATGTMGKMRTAFSTGISAVAAAVSTGGTNIKSSLLNDVEDSTAGAGEKFGAFKVAASDAMSSAAGSVTSSAKGIKGALGGMFSELGITPVMAGVIAAGAVIYGMYRSIESYTASVKDFSQAADKELGNTTGIKQFGTVMNAQLDQSTKQLAVYKKQRDDLNNVANQENAGGDLLTRGIANLLGLSDKLGPSLNTTTAQYQAQQAAVQHLKTENAGYMANLNAIAKANGISLPQAYSLAQAAGVSVTDMMSNQSQQIAINVLETQAADKAYGSLTAGIGGVKTAYSALSIENSQTMKNAQDVAGAFANFTSLITGGANAFDTWAQGETELNSNISKTGDVSSAVTLKLGKFSDKIAVTGKGMDGTTTAAIAANQAFLAQVNNSQALYGSLVQLSAASGNTGAAQHTLSEAGKDMISTLLKTAGGSKSAQTQLYALAQTFGYAGSDTLPSLVTWLGRSGDQTKDLQSRMNALTGAAGDLGNAAKALSGDLSTGLRQAEAKSIIDAQGGATAFKKFAQAVQAWAKTSDPKTYAAMIKSGGQLKGVFIAAAGTAKAAVPALAAYMMQLGAKNQKQAQEMAKQILGVNDAASSGKRPLLEQAAAVKELNAALKNLPPAVTSLVQVKLSGSGGISSQVTSEATVSALPMPSGSQVTIKGLAKGTRAVGKVPGWDNHDRQHAILEGGEAVVPKHLASRDDFRKWSKDHGIPGFSAGGIAGGATGRLESAVANAPGQADSTATAFTKAVGVDWASQIVKAAQKAATAAHVNYTPSAGVDQWKGIVDQALKLLHLPQSLDGNILYQMQTESGGNPNAINLSDSNAAAGDPSKGLMQVIGATFSAFHVPGTSSNIYDPLANVSSALNYARQRYGPTLESDGMGIGSGKGYAMGGLVKGFASGGKVHTLKPEGNVFGKTDQHMPEWARYTSRELTNRKNAEQAKAQTFKNAMEHDASRGLTAAYLTDSEKFNTWNTKLTGTKSAIKRRTKFDGESPAQQAKDIADTDKAVSRYYAKQQADSFGQIKAFGKKIADLKKVKKPNAAQNKQLASDEKAYSAALDQYMKDGVLSADWMNVFNSRMKQEEKISKAAGGTGSLLRMKAPTNSVMKVAEKLTTSPWVSKLSSGVGSTGALGWAMQPVLGDMMIAETFNPKQWQGKASSNTTYSAMMANWTAAMESVGGYLNSQDGLKAIQLAGAQFGIHGKQTQGPRASFMTGGTVRENITGFGDASGSQYRFHSGDKVTAPVIAKQQNETTDSTNTGRLLMLIAQKLDQGNTIARGQGREFGKELNQNASRRLR